MYIYILYRTIEYMSTKIFYRDIAFSTEFLAKKIKTLDKSLEMKPLNILLFNDRLTLLVKKVTSEDVFLK